MFVLSSSTFLESRVSNLPCVMYSGSDSIWPLDICGGMALYHRLSSIEASSAIARKAVMISRSAISALQMITPWIEEPDIAINKSATKNDFSKASSSNHIFQASNPGSNIHSRPSILPENLA